MSIVSVILRRIDEAKAERAERPSEHVNGRIEGLLEAAVAAMLYSMKYDGDGDEEQPPAPKKSDELVVPEDERRPNLARPHAKYVSGDEILHYIWDREGSVKFEYLVRDLYSKHRNGGHSAVVTLARLRSLGDVSFDIDDDGKIETITAHRMPKQ